MISRPVILYVITDLELGGVPLHLSRLARKMRERNYRVVVVSLAPIGPVGTHLSADAIEIRSCNGCCGLDYRVISRLGEIIDELNPELIHSFLFHANQAARIAAILGGFPIDRILCEIQTVEVERRWHLWVDRLMHRFCRVTIGNSPSVIEHLHRAAGIPVDRLQLVRGGVDLERIMNAQPADVASLHSGLRPINAATAKERCWPPSDGPGSEASRRSVLWVGRLDPVKGVDFLLRAVAMLAGKSDVRLLLVGDGPERNRLKALAQDLQLQDRVFFLGPRSDVPSLLKIAELFVFPSRTEGLPNALLEAMAAAKPIVATDVPGCRDLIQHEQTGLLVPYGDTPALAAAISRLLADAGLSCRLGQQAQRVAASYWNIADTWNAYFALYARTLSCSPQAASSPL
jgi:glycosyltransferase involved in cell wall biosynthesis